MLLLKGSVLLVVGVLWVSCGNHSETGLSPTEKISNQQTSENENAESFSLTTIPTGALRVGRQQHVMAKVPDGRVIIAGGRQNSSVLASTEIFNPTNNSWALGNPMISARAGAPHVVLSDGSIAVFGGGGSTGRLASIERFDSATGLWQAAGRLLVAREHHTATLLNDGRVLIVGGLNTIGTVLNHAEIWNPTTQQSIAIPTLPTARYGHQSILLPDGRVYVVGGANNSFSAALFSTSIYSPSTNSWVMGPGALVGRFNPYAISLKDGRVLVAGGKIGPSYSSYIADSEVFDPIQNKSTATGRMPTGHFNAALLQDSKYVYTFGGYNSTYMDTITRFDPTTAQWRTVWFLSQRRSQATAVFVGSKILVAGGNSTIGYVLPTDMIIDLAIP